MYSVSVALVMTVLFVVWCRMVWLDILFEVIGHSVEEGRDLCGSRLFAGIVSKFWGEYF